jgi:hypothetical protein
MKLRPLPAGAIAKILPSRIVFILMKIGYLSLIRTRVSRSVIRVLKTKRKSVYGGSHWRFAQIWDCWHAF